MIITPKDADFAREKVARGGLWEYVRIFWEYAEPGIPFLDNWHVGALCEFLTALIVERTLKRGVICMPTRMGKSTVCSVLAQSYMWTQDPGHRFLAASHDHKLVERDAQRIVDVVNSDLHQAAFPHVRLPRQLALKNLKTKSGGKRVGATPKGSGGTGWGSQTQVLDDMINVRRAMSKVEKQIVADWITKTMATRVDGRAEDFVRLLTAQRLDVDDPAQVVLDLGWTPLVLPMGEREGKKWLWVMHPDLWSIEDVTKLAAEMGSDREVETQLNQNPRRNDGDLIEKAWIKRYSKLPTHTQFLRWFQLWDFNVKGEKKTHSKTAWLLCFEWNNDIYIQDGASSHINYPLAKAKFTEMNKDPVWQQAGRILIEDKANGSPLVAEMRAAKGKNEPEEDYQARLAAARKIVMLQTGNLSKEERVRLQSDKAQAGRLYIREGLDHIVDEYAGFSAGADYDDLADLVTYALSTLDRTSTIADKQHLLDKILAGRRRFTVT